MGKHKEIQKNEKRKHQSDPRVATMCKELDFIKVVITLQNKT